jgi:cytidine deaminase
MNNAFAPFTKILVGAAVLGEDDKIYSGCNIESPFCIETTCAEYNAVNAMLPAEAIKLRPFLSALKIKKFFPAAGAGNIYSNSPADMMSIFIVIVIQQIK